jgi:hypothetical protein
MMLWCEQNGVDSVLGMARNKKLRALIEEPLQQARKGWAATGTPARV